MCIHTHTPLHVSTNGRTRRTPIAGWFIVGTSIYIWMILGVPAFQETFTCVYYLAKKKSFCHLVAATNL